MQGGRLPKGDGVGASPFRGCFYFRSCCQFGKEFEYILKRFPDFARCAASEFHCISGVARMQRANFTAFRALHVCSEQISLHFERCTCAASEFHCILSVARVQRANFTAFRVLHGMQGGDIIAA